MSQLSGCFPACNDSIIWQKNKKEKKLEKSHFSMDLKKATNTLLGAVLWIVQFSAEPTWSKDPLDFRPDFCRG